MAPAAVFLSPGGHLDLSAVHLIRGRKHISKGKTNKQRSSLTGHQSQGDRCVDTKHKCC